ncbi:hypothetical protein HY991_05595 [Candidatus Micrarchaeota archaeon]|nr:hypothetical protein [Candidatus Micrarchaeota archaeon]
MQLSALKGYQIAFLFLLIAAILFLSIYFHLISLPTALIINPQEPRTELVVVLGPQTQLIEVENGTEVTYPDQVSG